MAGLWFVHEDLRTSTTWVVQLGDPTGVEVRHALESPIRFLERGEAGVIWGLDFDRGELARIDPSAPSVIETVGIGQRPNGLAVAPDAVFVSFQLGGTPIVEVDPQTLQVRSLKQSGHVLDATLGHLWFSTYPGFDQVALIELDRRSEVATEVFGGVNGNPLRVDDGRVLIGDGSAAVWRDRPGGDVRATCSLASSISHLGIHVAVLSTKGAAIGLAAGEAGEAAVARITERGIVAERRFDGAYRLAGEPASPWIAWRPSKAGWNEPHDEVLHCLHPETLETTRSESIRGRVLAMA